MDKFEYYHFINNSFILDELFLCRIFIGENISELYYLSPIESFQ